MSVEFTAGVAYGWLLTNEEWNAINENTQYKYEDEAFCTDSWSDEGNYIIGEWRHRVQMGDAIPLDFVNVDWEYTQNFIAKYKHILEEGGYEKITPPCLYLIGQVS